MHITVEQDQILPQCQPTQQLVDFQWQHKIVRYVLSNNRNIQNYFPSDINFRIYLQRTRTRARPSSKSTSHSQQSLHHSSSHQTTILPQVSPQMSSSSVHSSQSVYQQSHIPPPHVLKSKFLEPPQYLAAIPVQSVIASNFPVVTSVLSPTPLSTPDLLSSNIVMTPAQNQVQDQLQRKHEELQHLIVQQQEELRRVSEQLIMARYGLLPAIVNVSVPFTTNVGITSTHNVISDVSHHQNPSHQIIHFEQMCAIPHPTGTNHGDTQNPNDIIQYLQLPTNEVSSHSQHSNIHSVQMNSIGPEIHDHTQNNELEVMPFQMSQAQAQILFSSNIDSPSSIQRCKF